MKRQLPVIITFIFAVIGILLQISPIMQDRFIDPINSWIASISSFAVIIGLASLVRHHATKIRRKHKDQFFSFVTFTALVVMATVSIIGYYHPNSLWKDFADNLYRHIMVPLNATMFALLAFYISSAAYRAFRARTWLAGTLLVSGFIVMLGRVAFGPLMIFGDVTNWLMLIPNTAAMRGIMIGVGLGMVATAIKIMLGIERSYLGGGE